MNRRLSGLLKPKYTILGCDIAGVVEAVGRDVKQFKPGDAVFGDVFGLNFGGFAEYVSAPESDLALKPANLSFDEAAAVPLAAKTALQGLRDLGHIQFRKLPIRLSPGDFGMSVPIWYIWRNLCQQGCKDAYI